MSDNDLTTLQQSRVVVVGPCASGKSTLVATLRARGYDATVTAQEHSAVPDLWRRAAPDVLIALVANIDAVQDRRDKSWPAWLHDVQEQRLASANCAADLVIDTSSLDAEEVAQLAIQFLEKRKRD